MHYNHRIKLHEHASIVNQRDNFIAYLLHKYPEVYKKCLESHNKTSLLLGIIENFLKKSEIRDIDDKIKVFDNKISAILNIKTCLASGEFIFVTTKNHDKVTLLSVISPDILFNKNKLTLEFIIETAKILFNHPTQSIRTSSAFNFNKNVSSVQKIINDIKNSPIINSNALSMHKKFIQDTCGADILEECANILGEISNLFGINNAESKTEYINFLQQYSKDAYKIFSNNLTADSGYHFLTPEEAIFSKAKKIFFDVASFNTYERNCMRITYTNDDYMYGVYDINLIDHNHIMPCHSTAHSIVEYRPIIYKKNKVHEFTVSQVQKLINNPYSFYVDDILRLKQIDSQQSRKIGIFIHKAIESFIKNNHILNYNNAIEKINHEIITNKSNVQKIIISSKIKGISDILLQLIKNADEVYSEIEGKRKIIYNNSNYTLRGRADLIYKSQEGKYSILDFKTGNVPSKMCMLSGQSPQISLMLLMLLDGNFTNMKKLCLKDIYQCGFISPNKLALIDNHDALVDAATEGIKEFLEILSSEQHHEYIPDSNLLYKCISRSYRSL